MSPHRALTRRSLVAGILTAGLTPPGTMALSSTPEATPDAFVFPKPIPIGNGLEVRDWRLSTGDGPSRFLVEVHNSSDAVVAAPTVGIVIPHLDSERNYGWADPFAPVIHPQESSFLVGLTPEAVSDQADFDSAEWTYCDPAPDDERILAGLEGLDYEIESSSVVHGPEWIECAMTVHNRGTKPIWSMRLAGIVRDAGNRICGGTAFSSLSNVEGGEILDMVVHVRPTVDMAASPFEFVDDLSGGSASFSLQPRGRAVNPGCPAVMPWNR